MPTEFLIQIAKQIDPDCQAENELLLHNGGKKGYVWSAGDPLGGRLELCLVLRLKVNGKIQPNPGRVTKGTDPSEMKVWVTTPWKEPKPDDGLLRVEEMQYG